MVASIFCSAMISAAPRSRNPRGSLALGRLGFCEAMRESLEKDGGCTGPPPWRQGTALADYKILYIKTYKPCALPLASPHAAMRTSPMEGEPSKVSSKVYPDAAAALKGVTFDGMTVMSGGF